jgi:hypothetical protein
LANQLSINESGDNLSDNDLYSQSDNPQSESLEMSGAEEDNFRMTPPSPNTPNLYSDSSAGSGVEDCSDEDDEEWENIDPRLRPVKPRQSVNVH